MDLLHINGDLDIWDVLLYVFLQCSHIDRLAYGAGHDPVFGTLVLDVGGREV